MDATHYGIDAACPTCQAPARAFNYDGYTVFRHYGAPSFHVLPSPDTRLPLIEHEDRASIWPCTKIYLHEAII